MGLGANFRKTRALWIVLAVALVSFVATSYLLRNSLRQMIPDSQTTTDTARRISLTSPWSYSLETGGRAPGDLPSPPANGWESFDPVSNWESAQGFHFFTPKSNLRYWLKTDFQIQYPIQNPALVLGKVPGSYRIFLNGHNIGDFEAGETLAFTAFDPSYFNLNGVNQILVSVHETTSLFHGFAVTPQVGSFIGDFNDVRKTVARGITEPELTASTFFAVTCGALVATLIITLARLLSSFTKSSDTSTSETSFPIVFGKLPSAHSQAFHGQGQELEEVHKKIAALVKATKSTLYIARMQADETLLETSTIIGSPTHVRQTVHLHDGLIASACEARKPWLIHDIGDVLTLGSRGQYETRSCIIIPLFTRHSSPELLGALTLADKEGSVSFTEEDLALTVEASSQLVQLLEATPLRRSRRA
jgi:hypothetical protein